MRRGGALPCFVVGGSVGGGIRIIVLRMRGHFVTVLISSRVSSGIRVVRVRVHVGRGWAMSRVRLRLLYLLRGIPPVIIVAFLGHGRLAASRWWHG